MQNCSEFMVQKRLYSYSFFLICEVTGGGVNENKTCQSKSVPNLKIRKKTELVRNFFSLLFVAFKVFLSF